MHVQDRADQKLEGDVRRARFGSRVAGHAAEHGSQGPARAVACHADAHRIDTEEFGIAHHIVQRGPSIGEAVRKGMQWRQAVIHRDHTASGLVAEAAAEAVMGIQAARHPAAAMEEQHARQLARRRAQRRIDTQGDMAVMHGQQLLAHAADFHRAGRIHQIGQMGERGAALFHILIAAAGLAGGGQHFQKAAGVTVQRHVQVPCEGVGLRITPLSA